MFNLRKTVMVLLVFLMAASFLAAPYAYAAETSRPFSGAKVNGGSVTAAKEHGKIVLTLSNDFQQKIDAPDPHWQVVDSKGNIYLLQRFDLNGGKYNREITLPAYIKDVAKVQFWCAYANILLGEADFARPARKGRLRLGVTESGPATPGSKLGLGHPPNEISLGRLVKEGSVGQREPSGPGPPRHSKLSRHFLRGGSKDWQREEGVVNFRDKLSLGMWPVNLWRGKALWTILRVDSRNCPRGSPD